LPSNERKNLGEGGGRAKKKGKFVGQIEALPGQEHTRRFLRKKKAAKGEGPEPAQPKNSGAIKLGGELTDCAFRLPGKKKKTLN